MLQPIANIQRDQNHDDLSTVPSPLHYSVLYSFRGGGDGAGPEAGLVRDAAGNLYGTTVYGGTSGRGVVFKLDPSGNETVLHAFRGGRTDGALPFAGLVRDTAGNLYSTTYFGGPSNLGVVFKLDPRGNETVLHRFGGGFPDGAFPMAGLIRDTAGNLYGTTTSGGGSGNGVVFKLDPSGHKTLLYRFKGYPNDGYYPVAPLVRDAAGNLYGTTYFGGPTDAGVVFKLDPSGNETILHYFKSNPDGAWPAAGLVRDPAGNLYGTTETGGYFGNGVVFKLDPSNNETILHYFKKFDPADGIGPLAGLVRDATGKLYGTTYGGGSFGGGGVVFELGNGSEIIRLHSFAEYPTDAEHPCAGLVRDAAGNLYGTTDKGGSSGDGVVFKLSY